MTKRDSNHSNNIKDNVSSNSEIKNCLLPENNLSEQKYLIKLGKIYDFIQYFTSLDLNKSIFIKEQLMDLIRKEENQIGNLYNSLHIIFKGKNVEKGKYCFLDKNIINFYIFHLYNILFTNVKSNLEEKIKEKNITGYDIINEIKEDISDEDESEIEDIEYYKKERLEDFIEIDENLCVLYSIYQFLINQYIKTLYILFNLKFNFFSNFLSKKAINKIKYNFLSIVNNLLSRIVFLNKEYLGDLYDSFLIKKNNEDKIIFPNLSLLNSSFHLDNKKYLRK